MIKTENSGIGATVARTVWDREAVSSNLTSPTREVKCGISTMVVCHPSKVETPVRIWYPAPIHPNFELGFRVN